MGHLTLSELYLTVSYFSIFSEYISILLSICLPVVIFSVILAIWLHYRQRKRKATLFANLDDPTDFSLSPADKASQSIAISPLAPEDRMGLIKECRKQLRKSRAKFMALKSDLTGTLKSIASNASWSHENDRHMEGLNTKIAVYEKQIADLQNKLAVLETAIPDHADQKLHPIVVTKEYSNKPGVSVAANPVFAEQDPCSSHPETVETGKDARLQHLQQKLQVLERENAALKMKIGEKEKEIIENRELLKNIYAELQHSSVHKEREIAGHPLS